ncbi:MAG TPA: hypothetical protein VGX51_02470 [Solirubrobacteraceae bacterium]|nr:hypothetical protein [Solirubrobacteraceae bacterium]
MLLGSGDHRRSEKVRLTGDAFVTAYPQGWTLAVKRKPALGARYQLSSTGAQVSGLGIPPAGTIGVTIDETPASTLSRYHLAGAKPDAVALSQNATQLLPNVVGTPRAAESVVRVEAPRRTRLDGADAAEEAYTYTYASLPNVQVDVLSHHGDKIVLVELDTEPGLGAAGQAALAAITGDWRWG